MKICIDPGHFGDNYNPGVSAGYVESNFTWTYSWLLKERLEKYGVEVILSRETKAENPGLQARGKKAAGCDLFISVHSNGIDNKPEMNAVVVNWSVRSGGEGIAKKIGNALTAFLAAEWGKIEPLQAYARESTTYPGYDYFGVLKGSASVEVPAVIIEHSFHTNKKYCEWAMQEGNLEKMADAEVQAIAEYYSLNLPVPDDYYYIPQTTNLKKGDKGEGVKRLQMRMRQISADYDEEVKAHSWKNGQPDGSFGGKMVETMKRFQQEAGLAVTGELDAETRALLNSNMALIYGELQGAQGRIQAARRCLND